MQVDLMNKQNSQEKYHNIIFYLGSISGVLFVLLLASWLMISTLFVRCSFDLKTNREESLLSVSDCMDVRIDGNTLRYTKDNQTHVYIIPVGKEVSLQKAEYITFSWWTNNVTKYFVLAILISFFVMSVCIPVGLQIDKKRT